MNPVLDTLVHFAFAVLLNGLWEAALIAIVCASVLRLAPAINATTRAGVLTAALIASLLLPIGTAFASMTHSASSPAASSAPVVPGHAVQRAHEMRTRAETKPLRDATPVAQPSLPMLQAVRIHVAPPRSAIVAVVVLWLLLALVSSARLAASLLHLQRLKHDALPLDVEYRSHMARWTRAAKGTRGVRLCRSPEIAIPIAVGLFDAMILIPETLIDELSPEDVDRIVLHELAHLRRGDDWINALERVAQALLFFNPGVLWIVGQLDLEREVVCDDWVLAQTAEVRQYATCLARVAEITAWPYRAMAAPGAFVTRRSMSIRIERLLQAGRDAGIRTSLGPAGSAVAAFVVLCIVAGYVSPSIAYTTAALPARATRSHEIARHRETYPKAQPARAAVTARRPTAAPAISATPGLLKLGKPQQAAKRPAYALSVSTIADTRTQTRMIADTRTSANVPATSPNLRTHVLLASAAPGYVEELASVGYANLSLDELIGLKSVGVTAKYIRDLQNAGLPHPTVRDLQQLAAVGVDGAYVRRMRAYFPPLSTEELVEMKAVGVSGSYVDALRSAGLVNLSAGDVRDLRAVGVDDAYIRGMRTRFPAASAGDLQQMRAVGVTPGYIDDLRAAGIRNLTASEARDLRAVDVDSEYVHALSAAGYSNLTLEQLKECRALGIDGAFIRSAAAHGFHNLTIDQLVRLKTSGIL